MPLPFPLPLFPGEILPLGDFGCTLHVFFTYNFGNVGRCRFSGIFFPGIVSIGGGIGLLSSCKANQKKKIIFFSWYSFEKIVEKNKNKPVIDLVAQFDCSGDDDNCYSNV